MKNFNINRLSLSVSIGLSAALLGTANAATQEKLTSDVSIKREIMSSQDPVRAHEISVSQVALPEKTKMVAQKHKTVNGVVYQFTKRINERGEIFTDVRDESGRLIDPQKIAPAPAMPVSEEVLRWVRSALGRGDYQTPLQVDIALDLHLELEEPLSFASGDIADGELVVGRINATEVDPKELLDYGERTSKAILEIQKNERQQRRELLGQWARQYGFSKAKGFDQSLAAANESLTLYLTAEQLQRVIEAKDERVAGIEVTPKVQDDIDSAMLDTGILDWALPYASTRGQGVGIYMTESGCAYDWRFSNYDRLSGFETDHSRNVGAIIRAVAPRSYLYCRGGAVLPNGADLDGVGGNPPIYIMTRSNGSAAQSNYTTLDRAWDNHGYSNNLAVFNSAGNSGMSTGYISSPGKALNTTAVGNYNDTSDAINLSSSYLDPDIGSAKPELSAPGTAISAGGFTMTGTSMSSPHAAAFTADMMSSSTYLRYRPYLAKAKLIAGATDPISGGSDRVGEGGIDFRSAQYSGYWSWWAGGNGSWSYFDQLDDRKDGYVTRRVYVNGNWDKVRVALAWMNRGSYTYSHRNDAHAIGMDLDLTVYDPNGNFVGGSLSWDNPYEVVNFQPTQTGYYTFKVRRYANRDSHSAVKMGLYVNYYNE